MSAGRDARASYEGYRTAMVASLTAGDVTAARGFERAARTAGVAANRAAHEAFLSSLAPGTPITRVRGGRVVSQSVVGDVKHDALIASVVRDAANRAATAVLRLRLDRARAAHAARKPRDTAPKGWTLL